MDPDKELKKRGVGAVMVVGGGIAGIQASLDLADSGFLVHLVDKKPQIGGVMAQLDKTFPTNDCSMCIISPKLVEAGRHLNIDLHTLAEIEAVSGEAGDFQVTLKKKARYVDLEKCTACGECAKVCPVAVPNLFDQGLIDRKAVFKLYPQGMPGGYAVEKRGTAPCKATCPAHVSVQGFIALMKQGKYGEALRLFKEEHPFPGVCGRVCHHPCESECARGDVDHPLAIRYMHRFLADIDSKEGAPYIPDTAERQGARLAVVGSGPAGLSAAYFLAGRGYAVTVFEKLPVKGGMMAVGIPEYRLPATALEKEIEVIEKMGVEIWTNMEFGSDITLDGLKKQGYGAVFLATGLHGGRTLDIEGEGLLNVHQGITFLRQVKIEERPSMAGRVVVIGGGNVAVDVALTAKRLGARAVTLACLEKRDEMPAWDHELAEAEEEDIRIRNSLGPVRFIEKNGFVSGVEFKACVSVFDEQGRFNPAYDENDLTFMGAEHVIIAIGQAAELEFAENEAIEVTRAGGLKTDPLTFQTPIPWVFAGGDAVYGPGSVVDAVACGKEAAESMHRFIQGKDLEEGRGREFVVAKPDPGDPPFKARVRPPRLAREEREGNFREVAAGLKEEEIRTEAERCLSCGICSECLQCVDACLAGAIDHSMADETVVVEAGAIIVAPGFTVFDPSSHARYNYGVHPNVVTSMEFERILSASGPSRGHLVRPSDGKEPGRIAWLQCVGSRDINTCDNAYCSSVCCMYAVKQTVIAKEHSKKPLEAAVFYMDMRTSGKDFDRYYMRAKNEQGVRFVRSRVHTVEPHGNNCLKLRYVTDSGTVDTEIFDMVVLSVGLTPGPDAEGLARRLGIALNRYNFAETTDIAPVETSRKGIYVCGGFQGPKDIPLSVMEASAAALTASKALSAARGTRVREKTLPPEIDVTGLEPRIAVFVCNCGINIGGIADVPAICAYAAGLPHVVHVEENLFTCSQDTQDRIKQVIFEKEINRVVVASCSPRTHEALFQETIREAGLNRFLFEMANIRDQNTWVHMDDGQGATAKAKGLVRMAVAKAARIAPLHRISLGVTRSLLVIGAGVAGMEAALAAADQGIRVYLVEREKYPGGVAGALHTTVRGERIRPYLEAVVHRVLNHDLIRVFLASEIVGTSGIIGNFETEIISANKQVFTTKVTHGATIIATGGHEDKPGEYHYGSHPGILTHLDLEAALDAGDSRLATADAMVFIQCVGSRSEQRPYCSRICCTTAIQKALRIRERNPETDIYILYRDIRTCGLREELYTRAREKGIVFIRYAEDEPPLVLPEEKGGPLKVVVREPVIDRVVLLAPDVVVLAAAIVPNENRELFEFFRVPVNSDGFLVEAHAKLRPVDFASDGIFLAGLAHSPKSLDETIIQAKAAVSRAMTVLSKERIEVGGVVAEVTDTANCACCLACVRSCPYGIPVVTDGHAYIEPARCRGCGVCAAECPAKAITLHHFTDAQMIGKTKALFA